MRSDMHKVIVDTGRCDCCGDRRFRSRRSGRRRWVSEGGTVPKEGMTVPLRHARAQRGQVDRLSPLRRWLDKQVGRPWDDVWSEVCTQFPRRSLMNRHLQDHLLEMVELCYSWDGQRVCPPLKDRSWKSHFVDPRSKVLRRIRGRGLRRTFRRDWGPHAPRRTAAPPHPRIELDSRRQLHRIDGIWYELRVRPVAGAPEQVRDRGLGRPVGEVAARERESWYGSAGLYASAKRQLGKRELKAHRERISACLQESPGRGCTCSAPSTSTPPLRAVT